MKNCIPIKSFIKYFLVLLVYFNGLNNCKRNSTDLNEWSSFVFDSVKVALYMGDAAWDDCKISTRTVLDELKINYVEITRDSIIEGCLKNYSVLYLPGGRPDLYSSELGDEGLRLIKNYVRMGGGYIGICGTGYLAAMTNIWRGWAGDPRIYQRYQSGLLGIFNGTADGPIEDFAPSYRDQHCLIEITNKDHPINCNLPDTVTYVYDHGPEFIFEENSESVILGESIKGDNIFILCTQFSEGKIFLSSGHPEFDSTQKNWQMISNAITWCSKLN